MGIDIPDRDPGICPLCCEDIGDFVGITMTDGVEWYASGLLGLVWPCIYTGYIEDTNHEWLWVWAQFCLNSNGDAEGGASWEPPEWTPWFFGPAAQCSSFTWIDPIGGWVVNVNVT
jgi:hypothetical protein